MKNFLEKFGYYKLNDIRDVSKKPFTENELGSMLSQLLGDVTEYSIEPAQEKEIFEKLREINGIHDYFRAMIAKDIQRYFMAASDSQRDQVKGAFGRTIYLKNKVSGKIQKVDQTKLANVLFGENVL